MMDYERGLETLKQLGQGTDWYNNILPHETALLDRLHDERLYGIAPQTHQEMMRTVDQLNRLSSKHTLILRAISDYGDERKEELDKVRKGALRRYAMHNAIHLLWRLFDAGILPL